MKISLLADHPEFIATLAPRIAEHWRPILGEETLESRTNKLRTHLNKDRFPIAWVAHSDGKVFGTAALRMHDLPGYEHLSPWLGGVYVIPEFRKCGVGAALCSTVEQEAALTFDISTLYLFTLDKQAWYSKLGWRMHEPCNWCGHRANILIKEVSHCRK